MTNSELKEQIQEMCMFDETILDSIILLEGDEFADGAIGLTSDNHVVYSYEKLVDSLSEIYGGELEAIEWLEYNTMRSLPYMDSVGNVPIIIHEFYREE